MDAYAAAFASRTGCAMIRGSWIPPVPLAFGAIFTAASWLLVLFYALDPSFPVQLAWIHTVALGAFTTIALSVLIHVIPGFTDLQWRGEKIARWCAVALPFAALGLVASFALMNLLGIVIFGTLAGAAAIVYVIPAIITLRAPAPSRAEGAIARAFTIVLLMLAIAAGLGVMLSHALVRGDGALLRFAPVHASVAIVGWLTMLTMGVSARTFRPILGSVSRLRALHIISNTGMLLCALGAAAGFSIGNDIVVRIAFACGVLAAGLYAVDGFDRVARATTPHRPAHVFIISALVWLLIAATAALAQWYALAVAVALAGWLGQMINAHLHHLGIRVIATTVAGDDNEARPWELLDLPIEWITVCAHQCAVVALAAGVAFGVTPAIVAAGVFGLCGTASFALNVRNAIANARRTATYA